MKKGLAYCMGNYRHSRTLIPLSWLSRSLPVIYHGRMSIRWFLALTMQFIVSGTTVVLLLIGQFLYHLSPSCITVTQCA